MDSSEMVGSGPKCEKAMIMPGNNQFRIVGPWERYWRHYVKDSVGQTHFVACAGPRSNCKLCAYVRANWDSNPIVRDMKSGTSNLFNVIDRRDKWCETNKHTKILCQWKSEIGVGPMAFEALTEVVNVNGPWEGKDKNGGDWDVFITKSGSGPTGTSYSAQAGRDRINLTDAEKKYESYDLAALIPQMTHPDEVNELIATISGNSTSSSEPPSDALTMDDLKKKDAPAQATAATSSGSKLLKKAAPAPEVKKKKNSEKCETDNCKGMLEFDDSDTEVTCPQCKSTYELQPPAKEAAAGSKESNPF